MAKKVTIEIQCSPKETSIVQRIADGKSFKDIAAEDKLPERKVAYSVDKLKSSFQAKTLGHLVATFFRNKMIK